MQNADVSDVELGMNGYIMFQNNKVGQSRGGVILYFKNSIPVVQVHMFSNAEQNESLWFNIATLNSP